MKRTRQLRRWLATALFALNVGHSARAAAESPIGPVVELPPMVIEEHSNLPPWLYVQADGGEYLSRCSASTTRDYVDMRRTRMQWVRSLFPDALMVHMAVPAVTVLVSQKLKPSNNAEIIGEVMDGGGRRNAGRAYVRATTAPNMMLTDSDAIAVFAYVDEKKFDRNTLTIATDYVRYLLERRAPALPGWLLEGLIAVYNDVQFVERPITLRPLTWAPASEAQALRRNAQAPRTLLSIAELFSDEPRSHAREEIGHAQAALLVRWALDPRNNARESFWKFAQRACEEPASEELFESCFGFGFTDLRDRLSDYLPTAVRSPLQLPLEKFPPLPPLETRRATPAEIARLRGEWERLSVPLVQHRFPEHTARYREQARRTLQAAIDAGERDPRLIAIFGLCEADAHADATALEYLQEAAARGVVRPRAYYELARLRWQELTRDETKPREFEPVEVLAVLQPLRRGLGQAPPLPAAFELLATVWSRCRASPPAEDIERLVHGGQLFATEPRLCLKLARALGRHGRSTEAIALLGRGFLHVRDNPTREQFAQLYALLTQRR